MDVGDDLVQRDGSGRGQLDGLGEVFALVDACAQQLQLSPEEAEEIDFRRLAEDADDDDTPACARQFGHDR